MRKTLLFSLLFVATTMFAATKVETFKPDDEAQTNTYCTTATSKTCDQATWEFLLGGTRANDVGNFGHWAAVFRAKKTSETVDCAYIKSSTIGGGIDSLWFQWNSNANETGNWRILIYINNQLIDSITDACGSKIPAGGPFNKFGHGGLQIEGDFTIRFENRTPYNGNSNAKRFVIDSLCWTTYGAPEKEDAELAFAENSVLKMIGAAPFTNVLTKKTDATPVLSSSAPEVATIDQDGQVTIIGVGTTVISAVVAETETYKADSVAYTLRVVPLNFHLETFDGAANITSGTGAYLTNDSVCPPSEATGIVWTTHLGSVRDGFGSWPAGNMACAIRGKKAAEATYGYLLSDSIEGGIDSLAFDWNSNGDESARQHNWNIAIYINGDSVGAITDKPTGKQAAGHEFRYAIGNLKTEGKFVIKIVNLNDADDGTSNNYRWVMDNLEWFSYEAPCEPGYGILVDGTEYIAGIHNDLQPDYLEYVITAQMDKDETFVFADHCSGGTFMANQESGEGNYLFNYTEGNTAFVAPATGTYTIYLKMYGPDNNWIWTVYAAPKYEVTIANPTNGTLVVMNGENEVESGDSIAAQTVLTIIPTPAEGYQIATVTVNGQELTPQENVYTFTMGYEDLEIAATFDEVCEPNYGILVDDTEYIAGIHNELQPDYLEYVITAHLNKDATFVFKDYCSGGTFMASQESGEGNYLFNYTEGNTAFVAPAAGTYTIYLKLKGYDNNWIWTDFVADETGIENTGVKADVRKSIEDGMVIIYRNGKRYNLTGAEIR